MSEETVPLISFPFFLFFIIVFFIRIYGGVISLTAAIPYAEIKETQVYSRPALSIYDWLSRPDSFPAMASKFLFLSLSLFIFYFLDDVRWLYASTFIITVHAWLSYPFSCFLR